MYRVIWQYDRDPAFTLGGFKFESLAMASANAWADVDLVDAPEPVFRRDPLSLLSSVHALATVGPNDPLMRMPAYFHAFAKEKGDAEKLVARLSAQPSVHYTAIQERPEPAVRHGMTEGASPDEITPSGPGDKTRDLSALQRYLHEAPGGVDALFAWNNRGGRGEGVRIVDIEYGWNLQHEDLADRLGGVFYGQGTDSDHGTAVLGIFGGDLNDFGIKGIAPDAITFCASATYDSVRQKWNAADAIRASADKLSAGDIILLEMHAPGPNALPQNHSKQQGFVAVEYWQTEFDAIRYATTKGIHVVEAAGNGGEDLDGAAYRRAFDRSYRDSGAILVGGGQSALNPHPRSRCDWSNYGSRVDVQGWGVDIVTAGGRQKKAYYDLVPHSDPSRCYTKSFGGTSGASPIVVGVVACLSGIMRAAGHKRLTPQEMRTLLSTTGTAQSNAPGAPANQNIGPLPNLRAAMAHLAIA